jgi:hypothetical protein
LRRRLAGPFEENVFISLYENKISKESNTLLFNENLFTSSVEEGNIS